MNCQEFENSLDALARGRLADARTRREASEHAETCARCAARLADERALTEGLRALRSKLKTAEAPPRVEAALLATLGSRVGVSTLAGRGDNSANAGRDNISTAAASAGERRWSWTKTVAVAALAAAAALAFFMLIPPSMSLPPPRNAGEVAQTSAGDAGKAGGAQPSSGPQDLAKDDGGETNVQQVLDDRRGRPTRAVVSARQPVRAISAPAVYNTAAALGSRVARGGVEEAGDEEVTTDFIPLMQGGRFAQGEGGHLVRVELPRSALISFGLPVNAEAAGGRVKADVLLGEDGTARAIRFVR
jgi:hypothetical protein